MDRERLRELVDKFNKNEISSEEMILLERAIEEGGISLNELESLAQLDNQLNFEIPEPSENLRLNFYQNLAGMKSKSRAGMIEGLTIWFTNLGLSRPALQIIYASVLIIMGFGVGFWVQPGAPNQKIDELSSQVSEMKELMMLTLIEKPAATDRLKAVSMAKDVDTADERVITALLNTLNNDENANVRLATLEALLRYADNPIVRQGLVEAIPNQDDAMLQYALAEAMILIQEKNSVQNFRELLKDENIDKDVKNKIEETISKLS